VSTEVAAEQLLKGLMDDDTRLFQDENTPIDFVQAAEDTGMDEVTQEILEEVDRTRKGFEQTTRLHSWLGDLGMNAEAQLLAEADRARTLGDRAAMVDLERFVTDAVRPDGELWVGTFTTTSLRRSFRWPGVMGSMRSQGMTPPRAPSVLPR
jgi:hypothetical protein